MIEREEKLLHLVDTWGHNFHVSSTGLPSVSAEYCDPEPVSCWISVGKSNPNRHKNKGENSFRASLSSHHYLRYCDTFGRKKEPSADHKRECNFIQQKTTRKCLDRPLNRVLLKLTKSTKLTWGVGEQVTEIMAI